MQPDPELIEYRGYEIKLTRSGGLIDAAYRRIREERTNRYGTRYLRPCVPDQAWTTMPFQSTSRAYALMMASTRVDMLIDKVTQTVCPLPPNPSWQVKDYQGKRKPVAVEGGAA